MKETDILLISPFNVPRERHYLPYGLLYIASHLRENGFDVRINDRNINKEDVRKTMKKINPKTVGISCFTGPMIRDAIEISKIIKKEFDVPVIWGGLHPTLFPVQILQNWFVDFIVMGEGEKSILDLLKNIDNPSKYSDVKGIAFKHNGKIKINSIRDFIMNLDELPKPAWNLIKVEKYFQKKFYGNRVLTHNTSRGCPWRCAYCYNQAIHKRIWRGLNAERIVEEVKFLKEKYKIDGIHFFEDNFEGNMKRFLEFCKLMIKEKIDIPWHGYSRVNYSTRENLLLRKRSGCSYIEYGVESGSPRMLEFMKKDTIVPMIKEAYKKCKELDIFTSTCFMIGLPTETVEDMNMTVNLVESLQPQYYQCNIFKPYPGTEFFDFCIKNKLFKLPKKMEDFADIFSYDPTAELNVSKIPVEILLKTHKYFVRKNHINEVMLCLKHNKFRLLLDDVKHATMGRIQEVIHSP